MAKIRLFIENNNLHQGVAVKLCDNNFDYLVKVMRQKVGDSFCVFNGSDGDFLAQIKEVENKSLVIEIVEKIADLKKVPNVTIAFAPVKNVRE